VKGHRVTINCGEATRGGNGVENLRSTWLQITTREKLKLLKRMMSSVMLGRVALLRTDVSEELSPSFIRVTRIGEVGTTLAVTSNRRTLRRNTKWYLLVLVFLHSVRRFLVTTSVVRSSPILVTLMKEVLSSCETSVLTRATRRNIPEDTILHNDRREKLKSYIALTGWTL
jgi:hypothetical protein